MASPVGGFDLPEDGESGAQSGAGRNLRRLMLDVGPYPGAGGLGRTVYVGSLCNPTGPRRLMRYIADYPAFWTGGAEGSGNLVPSRPLYVGGECVGTTRIVAPGTCFPPGWTFPEVVQVLQLGRDSNFVDTCYYQFCGNPTGQPYTLVYDASATANSLALFGTQYAAVWTGFYNNYTPVVFGIYCFIQPVEIGSRWRWGYSVLGYSLFTLTPPPTEGSGSGVGRQGCFFGAFDQFEIADDHGNSLFQLPAPVCYNSLGEFQSSNYLVAGSNSPGNPGCCAQVLGIPPAVGRAFIYEPGCLTWDEDPSEVCGGAARSAKRFPRCCGHFGSGSGDGSGTGSYRTLMSYLGAKGLPNRDVYIGTCCPSSGSGGGAACEPDDPPGEEIEATITVLSGTCPILDGANGIITQITDGTWQSGYTTTGTGCGFFLTLVCAGGNWTASITTPIDGACSFDAATIPAGFGFPFTVAPMPASSTNVYCPGATLAITFNKP